MGFSTQGMSIYIRYTAYSQNAISFIYLLVIGSDSKLNPRLVTDNFFLHLLGLQCHM